MKPNKSAALATGIALVAATIFTVRLAAQEPQTDIPPPVRGSVGEPGLQQMLVDLGYEPKKLKQGYVVAIKEADWTYNVQLVLSANREKIGLNANVGNVEDPAAVAAKEWLGVLAANTDIAPSFFYFNKNNKTLYIHRVVDNRLVTGTLLRKQIEAFTANIKETADVWKFTK